MPFHRLCDLGDKFWFALRIVTFTFLRGNSQILHAAAEPFCNDALDSLRYRAEVSRTDRFAFMFSEEVHAGRLPRRDNLV